MNDAEPAPSIPKGTLMAGKRGLIMGVANDRSIAWGIAQAIAAQGGEVAFTYQGEALEKRVRPLAESLGSSLVVPCDVADDADMDAAFGAVEKAWGGIDFLVHAIGFADKQYLRGRYLDTPREAFLQAMDISCYSFVAVGRRAAALMKPGGAQLTLSYLGAERVIPHYNVMGVAKAALEASVRYLASDYGPDNIRVNAISAGPVRTLAGAGIADARLMFNYQKRHAPLRRTVSIEEIGGSGLYLLSDLSTGVTGEIHYVDSGYNIISMPSPDALKTVDAAETAAENAAQGQAAE